MSLPIGAQLPVTRASTGSSRASSLRVSSDGLTTTSPATSGRSSARRMATVPPIDRPAQTTESDVAASSSRACWAAATQSSSETSLQSCQRVPCPGSSGQRTAKPAAARCSPHGRMLIGVPVNPCTSSTPVRPSAPVPPGNSNGSAPGSTAAGSDTWASSAPAAGPTVRQQWGIPQVTADCRAAAGLPSLAVPEGGVLFYWFLKFVAIGPVVKLVYRPDAAGTGSVPATGAAILASNHLSAADWIFMPLSLKRRVTFLAKAEYFTGRGLKGFLQRVFFAGSGQVPIDRTNASAAEDAIQTGLRILREGKLLGIYPEGTRSPDRRLFRGKTGVARMTLETGAPVIPVAMIYGSRPLPFGRKMPRGRVRFGKPLDFSRYAGLSGDRFVERSITDEIMYEIMTLSGQEYVDVYGATVKKSMDATGATAAEVLAKLQPPVDEAADRAPTSLAG